MAGLKNKAMNGIKWSAIDNLAGAGVMFIIGLILARLLSPADFGVIGIVTIFINLFNTLANGSLDVALIRKIDADENDFNTVFYSNIFFSLLLIAILIASAGWISAFFAEPILKDIIPVMSLIILINALSLIQRTYLIKRVDFRTQAIISLCSSLVSGVIGIIMAVCGYGVWSLVWQQISRHAINALLLWCKKLWKPKAIFSFTSFSDLFGFSWKILLANIINSLFRDAFLAVIGKVHSSENLGQYNRAEQFKGIFTNNLSQIIQKVSMPVMSEVQNDKDRFRYGFRKIIIYSALITFPLGLSMLAIAKPMIMVLIGEKWMPAVRLLQIMCLYAIISPLAIVNANIMNILKRSDLYLKIEIAKKLLFILVILTGVFYSIETMLWCAVSYYYVDYIITGIYSKRLSDYGILEQIKDVAPIAVVCGLISAAVWSVTLLPISYLLMLIIQVSVLFVAYFVVYKIATKPEIGELVDIVVAEIKNLLRVGKSE